MALNRRNFLRATLAGAAVAAGSSAFAACGGKAASTEGCPAEKGSCPNSKAELKISFQEGIAPGANLNEKFDLMEKLGVVGFEPGGRGLKDRVKEIKEALNRRNFLRATLAGAAVAAGSSAFAACGGKAASTEGCPAEKGSCPNSKAELKISFQEGIAPGANLNEKFDLMEKLGVVGFEPGGRGLKDRVKEIKEALNGRNIKVSAICAGFQGFILSTDPAIRKQCMDTMKEIIAPAGELGSTGVIIVPAFNGQKPAMPHTQETRDFLCEQFNEMGNFAKEHGTTVIFEPLNRKEAFYLRQVADAASICRDINNPGVRCMGDFWHMTWEETSDMGAFLSAGEYLQHVHVASRKRRSMPGEDGEADNYVNGFKGLKMLDYDKYVSFECGCQGDRNVLVPAAVELLRKQWEEA